VPNNDRPAALAAISNDTIVTLMSEFPELVLSMLKNMASKLRETTRLIT
jgi:CRP-like cAMP-binding protein